MKMQPHDKQETLRVLNKIASQVTNAIIAVENDDLMFNCHPKEMKPGYEIGDFVITPRFPKTDFQG